MKARSPPAGIGWLALCFVLLWCTGYVVAKLSLPDAGPVSFLGARYGFACVAMAFIAWLWRAPWPRRRADYGHCVVVGVLVHGLGLGGVWVALDQGVEAGVAALIMGSQPLWTVLLAVPLLRERITLRVIAGLVLGFSGVVAVIHHKLGAGLGTGIGLAVSSVGVIAITLGTLYQKRLCAHLHLMSGNAVQLAAAGLLALVLAPLIGDRSITWTAEVIGALAWSVFVLSIGATVIYYSLFRRGAASQVASLLYLVPPVTAIMAWVGFGETIGIITLGGMVLSCAGVALVLRAG